MGTQPQQAGHGPLVRQNVPSGQPVRGMSPAMIQQQQQQKGTFNKILRSTFINIYCTIYNNTPKTVFIIHTF